MEFEKLDESSLELIISRIGDLDQNNQIALIAELMGYKSMPPSIDQFISDPFYLGDVCYNLYDYWKDILRKIYPTPIHTRYPILVFKGAIGTGKSTVVRVMAEYTKCRLAHMRDPWKSMRLMSGKNIKFSFFHKSVTLAETDFLNVLAEWESSSPYFKQLLSMGALSKYECVADSTRINANIGSDVIFYNLSELNFVNQVQAREKLDQAFKRWKSRFRLFKNYIGHIIVDTSAQGDDSIADDFANNNPYGDDVLVINTNQWVVKAHQFGRNGYFKVYAGDSIHQPYIMQDTDDPTILDLDQDRVIDVPTEFRSEFEFDIVTALQDLAGISTKSSNKFFPDPTGWKNSFKLPQYGPDVVSFDFYDKTDKLIYKFDRYIRDIPRDRIIYIRYDVGVVGDNTGLAIAYFNQWRMYNKEKNVRLPEIYVPLAVGISRERGQETSLSHLFEFLMDLNERFEIGRFTADQFQSRMILQDLTREGIPNRYLSVDRTDEAGRYTKQLANNGLLFLPNNKLLLKEGAELVRIGNKLDHTSSGSKDIFDAVSGVVFDLYQDIDKAGQISVRHKVESHTDMISQRARSNDSYFQERMASLF